MKSQFHQSINDFSTQQWNALCPPSYPFIRHEFLSALEDSNTINTDSGWTPQHLSVSADDKLLALMPLYLKDHSFGEFVFDWAWADAYERNGFQYYPKLMTAIPFTPATGPRILLHPELEAPEQLEVLKYITDTIKSQCETQQLSSWHTLFPSYQLAETLEAEELLIRKGCQFHWHNKSFKHFDDFLALLASRKRKSIKRERRKVAEQNIELKRLPGKEITPSLLEAFYEFYQNTYAVRGQKGYLNLEFFQRIIESMPENILMNVANRGDTPVAAAFCFLDKECLYGRYWGCNQSFDNLHFETCYYQGIEHCIEHNIPRFDPGAQGEHKVPRGFEPTETWSTHWITHPGFKDAIGRFLKEEARSIDHYIQEAKTLLPFKSST